MVTVTEIGDCATLPRVQGVDRVSVICDDARSFFATARDRYDVISFGLLMQSITFVTGIRALLLIVTAFYVAALLSDPARRVTT